MTKVRAPLSFELALTKVAGRIGWERVTEIVGKSRETVRLWSDPDAGAGITLDKALKLDLAFRQDGGDGAPFLTCYALRLDADAVALHADSRELSLLTARAAKESGEAIEAAIAAALPGASPQERARAELELEEAAEAVTNILSRLRAPEVAPPAPSRAS